MFCIWCCCGCCGPFELKRFINEYDMHLQRRLHVKEVVANLKLVDIPEHSVLPISSTPDILYLRNGCANT